MKPNRVALVNNADELSAAEVGLTTAGMFEAQLLPHFGLFELLAIANTSRYLRTHFQGRARTALSTCYRGATAYRRNRGPFREVLFVELTGALRPPARPYLADTHVWRSLQAMYIVAMEESIALATEDGAFQLHDLLVIKRKSLLSAGSTTGLPPALRLWKAALDSVVRLHATRMDISDADMATTFSHWLCAALHWTGFTLAQATLWVPRALSHEYSNTASMPFQLKRALRWHMLPFLLDAGRYAEDTTGFLERILVVLKLCTKRDMAPPRHASYEALDLALRHFPVEALRFLRWNVDSDARWHLFQQLAAVDRPYWTHPERTTRLLLLPSYKGEVPAPRYNPAVVALVVEGYAAAYVGADWTLARLNDVFFFSSMSTALNWRDNPTWLDVLRNAPLDNAARVILWTANMTIPAFVLFKKLFAGDPASLDLAMATVLAYMAHDRVGAGEVMFHVDNHAKSNELIAACYDRATYDAVKAQLDGDVTQVAVALADAPQDPPGRGYWVHRMMNAAHHAWNGLKPPLRSNVVHYWHNTLAPMFQTTPFEPHRFPPFPSCPKSS